MATEVGQVNDQLAMLSEQVLPHGLRLFYANVADLREQDINARSMTKQAMDQLILNVKRVGALESVPLCARVGEHIEIISGHHRVRAARDAGIQAILILLYENLDASRLKAKQLAHNSITGVDDPELVKRIWDGILDVQARFEAFIDPRVFNDLPEVVAFKPVDIDLDRYGKRVTILFLTTQQADLDAALALLGKADHDEVLLANMQHYEQWMQALRRVQKELDIKAVPTAIAQMAQIVLEYFDNAA